MTAGADGGNAEKSWNTRACTGCRVWGAGFRVQGSGCTVQGVGFRVQGSGFRVQGSEFACDGPRCVAPPYIRMPLLSGSQFRGLFLIPEFLHFEPP